MSEQRVAEIQLSRDQEEILALVPEEARREVAKKLGVTASLERPESSQGAAFETPQPSVFIVGGLALVLTAGLVLAGVYLPKVISSGTARLACALGLVGLTIAFFGVAGVYLARDSD